MAFDSLGHDCGWSGTLRYGTKPGPLRPSSQEPFMTSRILAALLLVAACSEPVTRPSAIVRGAAAPGDEASAQTFYGPERFTRSLGGPTRFSRTIPTVGFEAPFTVHVRNGAANGSSRVSSGRVMLGGVELLSPRDFNQQQSDWQIPVNLGESATLEVELTSKPGSYLEVSVTGTPKESFAYVTAYSGGTWKLNKIAVSTHTVVHTLDASLGAGLAITPTGAHVYVSGNPTKVVATATNTVVASIGGLGTDPWQSAVTPNGAFVYLANHNSSNVSVISTATNTVVATIPVGTDHTEWQSRPTAHSCT